MRTETNWFQKVRFFGNVSVVYALTIAFGVVAFQPSGLYPRPAQVLASSVQPPVSLTPAKPITAGKPVRIVIPASSVDLPVDEGQFDGATQTWSLSGYRAQFATISTLANDQAGDTFIYGHNNNYVFGALRHHTPQLGAQALLYTDNGHVFSYSFSDVVSVTPHDTAILNYQGPPRLTIQTCTGAFNEWRTLYHFKFDRVLQ